MRLAWCTLKALGQPRLQRYSVSANEFLKVNKNRKGYRQETTGQKALNKTHWAEGMAQLVNSWPCFNPRIQVGSIQSGVWRWMLTIPAPGRWITKGKAAPSRLPYFLRIHHSEFSVPAFTGGLCQSLCCCAVLLWGGLFGSWLLWGGKNVVNAAGETLGVRGRETLLVKWTNHQQTRVF